MSYVACGTELGPMWSEAGVGRAAVLVPLTTSPQLVSGRWVRSTRFSREAHPLSLVPPMGVRRGGLDLSVERGPGSVEVARNC